MGFYGKHKATINKIVFVALTVFSLYIFFNVLYSYVSPFVWGFVLSLILVPPVNFITSRTKIPRALAVVFSLLVILLSVGLVFNSLIGRIIREAEGFIGYLPQLAETASNTFDELSEKFNIIYDIIPLSQQADLGDLATNLVSNVTGSTGAVISSFSTSFVTRIPNALISFILCLISAFFFAKDKELISSYINSAVPEYFKTHLAIIKEGIISGIIGYIKAQCILMSVVAIICITGLSILGAPYALFLGIIIAFVDAVPVFGSGFFYWPWIAYSMLTGDYRMAAGLGVIYICVLLTRQLLEPKILGVQIGVHPLITLISIYVGMRIFGFLGIFIGPCIAIIIKSIYEMPAFEQAE